MNILVLGSGQDAGVPQFGCDCYNCRRARQNHRYERFASSLAVFDESFSYIIDASPDFKKQIDWFRLHKKTIKSKRKLPLNGIFLTHAHIGHYIGLLQLGREVTNEQAMPVYCTSKMAKFLSSHFPFSQLVRSGNIVLRKITPQKRIRFDNWSCTPVEVAHRNEMADTVAYLIQGRRTLFYMPDVDNWNKSLINIIKKVDIAVIDGSFFSKKELPRFKKVPHPPICESIELLRNISTKIYFTHFNHTNPVLYKSKERILVEHSGFHLAFDKMTLKI